MAEAGDSTTNSLGTHGTWLSFTKGLRQSKAPMLDAVASEQNWEVRRVAGGGGEEKTLVASSEFSGSFFWASIVARRRSL